jgi:hypothetical protein
MTTEDPRIEQARQIIAHALAVSCDLGELTMYVERVDRALSTPAVMAQKAVDPNIPHNDPERVDENGRYTPPPGFRVKCHHCDNDATHADSCPYQRDVNDDETLVHFWCDRPECEAIVRADQREAADCI